MKEKMFKYFTSNSTRKYIDILDEFVKSYNNTNHSSIKMTPTDQNESAVIPAQSKKTSHFSKLSRDGPTNDIINLPFIYFDAPTTCIPKNHQFVAETNTCSVLASDFSPRTNQNHFWSIKMGRHIRRKHSDIIKVNQT